jgi:hypothetical protein
MALRQLCLGLARRAGSSAQTQILPSVAVASAAAHSAAPVAAAGRALLLQAARAFSSSGPAPSDDLHSLIKRELQHEQTTYEQPEPLAKGPPAPFTVSGAPGDGTVTLKRDYKGETISVDAAVNLQVGGLAGQARWWLSMGCARRFEAAARGA